MDSIQTALLCSLLVDNGQIKLSDLSYDIHTEKLLSASSAILSSFTIENHNDIGMRVSTKLLQSHITPENLQVTSHVATMLNKHWPKTDAEVKGLLEICLDAVERGSFRMLDACESLCFSRSICHKKKHAFDASVHWLLRGVECATKLGANQRENDTIRTDVTRSMCYRHLTKLCVDLSSELLTSLSIDSETNEEDISRLLQIIKQVKKVQVVLLEDEISELILADPSVSLLNHVSDIGWNRVEKNDKVVAKSIVHCLEERKDLDGSVITLSYPGFYGLFLSLAFDILSEEDKPFGEITDVTVSFDVYGMQVLFCCLDCYCKAEKYGAQTTFALRADITLEKMRVALGRGLMRAFVAQNALMSKEGTMIETQNTCADSTINLDRLLGPSM